MRKTTKERKKDGREKTEKNKIKINHNRWSTKNRNLLPGKS